MRSEKESLTAVVDTNVLVVGILSASPRSASRKLVDSLRQGQFRLAVSPAVLFEIDAVLNHPRLQRLHGLSEEAIRRFCRTLEVGGRMHAGILEVSAAITRDVTDTKWVALALEANADFLVSLDRRHLQRLKRVGTTKIVTPRSFVNELARQV